MDKSGRLMLFVAAVQAGSFSRAAAKLKITRSVFSKQIARLEQELGSRLINRTTRSFNLTEVGQLVYQEALKVRATLDDIDNLVDSHQAGVSGRLKISCVSHFGRSHLQQVIYQFMADHPAVSVEFSLTDRMVDIIKEGVDLAVRITEPQDSTLIVRKLVENKVILVASPDYLERYGTPGTPDELSEHRCVAYGNTVYSTGQWRYLEGDTIRTVDISPVFIVNDGNCMLDAVKAGTGIGVLARFVVGDELEKGEIIEVLPDVRLPPFSSVYVAYPARHYLPAKTRVFLDYLYNYVKRQGLL